MEAWTGLPPVRIDDYAHDPIVLDAGTIVGIASGGSAAGKLFPATPLTGDAIITMWHHSDGATWALPAANVVASLSAITGGPVKPLGMVFEPIYSFILQAAFHNYKRQENVGIVTDYLIQLPARNAQERAIKPGDKVMVNEVAKDYGFNVTASLSTMGTLQSYDQRQQGAGALSASTAAHGDGGLEYVVGTCFQNLLFASDSSASANALLDADIPNVSLTTAGAAEFKGLSRVQTVPGLNLAGSGTNGVPAWLTKARQSADGDFYALTILFRL
jgi:hypothetical protein